MGYLDGLARLLDSAGVATYAPDSALPDSGVVVSTAGSPPTEGAAVTLTPYQGPEPDSWNGWSYPRVQVRVRHADAVAARDLDAAVYGVLQARGPETLPDADATTLQDCYALQSAPAALGQDDNGRHEFTRNYQLTINP